MSTSKPPKRPARPARRPGSSEIREKGAEKTSPKPRIPLVPYGLGAPDIAERAHELLDDFSR